MIAKLFHSAEQSFQVHMMNVAKQSGSMDCGLYTLANMTCLLLEADPTTLIFGKDELRPHLVQVLQCSKITKFPVKLCRHPFSRVQKILTCKVYCFCRFPEWSCGDTMVCCGRCQERYHIEYLVPGAAQVKNWFCNYDQIIGFVYEMTNCQVKLVILIFLYVPQFNIIMSSTFLSISTKLFIFC